MGDPRGTAELDKVQVGVDSPCPSLDKANRAGGLWAQRPGWVLNRIPRGRAAVAKADLLPRPWSRGL